MGQIMFDSSSKHASHRLAWRRLVGSAVFLSLLLSAGCTVVRPWTKPWNKARRGTFSHADFDRVLKRFVNKQSMVDYAAIKVYRDEMEDYYKQLTFYSPDSHPQMFPTDAHKLAYWINAYNASVIKMVMKYYPIRSVTEVNGPIPINFIAPKSGFFVAHRILLGGDTYSLSSLESLIRERFRDPRVSFALNGAARGCPRLWREAYNGEHLETQLERATKYFFSEDRNLLVDHDAKAVYMSPLLSSHKGDLKEWLERTDPESESSVLAYAELYAPVEKSSDLAMAQDYDIEYTDFDWRLNDSNAPE